MNKEPRQRPQYEIITIGERNRRDPRGMVRVTLLGEDLIRVEKGLLSPLQEGPAGLGSESGEATDTSVEKENQHMREE